MAITALEEPKIRQVYTPQGDELQTLRYVYTRYWQMRDNRNGSKNTYNYEGDWDKWEKQWNAYRPPRDADDWKSNIYIPLTTSIIEAQLSEIIDQTLMPWATERGAEDQPKAKVINSILEYTWDQAKSDLAMFQILKDALIFGTGIGMEYYWREPRTIKDEQNKERRVFDYDDCYLEPVRLWDFFVDERARSFTGPYGARDCIRRYIMDYDDFRNFFSGKTWDPVGNAKYVKPGGDTNYYEFYRPPERIQHDREVEVLWYWNKPDDLLCIVANDVLVVNKPNPYKHKQLPFVRAIDVHRPYQFYGKGEAELLESLQEEINTLRRMTIDRNHLDIDKPILVSDTLTIEDEDTIARPHGVIPVGDVNGAKPMEYGDIPQSTFKQLEMLNDDKVRISGMDERQQGVSSAGTATEAAILKESTLKRLNLKMWQMKQDTLVDIGRLRVENIMQFYSQPKIEKIIGDSAVAKAKMDGSLVQVDGKNYKASYRNIRLKDQKMQINPQTQQPDLQPTTGFTFFEAKPEFFLPTHGGYDIRYKSTPSLPISRPLQQQKMDELYDRLIKNPAVDPWQLAKLLLESREQVPDDFKRGAPQGPQGQQQEQGANLQKIIDLAGMENAEMIQGKEIGPTPYAPVVHTDAHIQFMQSEQFKKDANEKVLQIFTQHVIGEIAAQHMREAQGGPQGAEAGGMPPGMPGGGMQPPSGAEIQAPMGNVVPDRMMGGGETQNISGAQQQ